MPFGKNEEPWESKVLALTCETMILLFVIVITARSHIHNLTRTAIYDNLVVSDPDPFGDCH